MKKKADMGIGTLIIFIAMILVAAIAAGVLIQTATSLQNKALLTGDRSKSQVSTSVRPMLVYAEDGSSGNNVDEFYMKIKLAPGSDSVRFRDMLVEFSLKDLSTDISYNGSLANMSNGSTDFVAAGYTEADENASWAVENVTFCDYLQALDSTFFGIEYLIQGDNFDSGYLQRGDVAKLCFRSSRAVLEDETVTITMVPKIGSPTVVQTALPDIITEKRITIYP